MYVSAYVIKTGPMVYVAVNYYKTASSILSSIHVLGMVEEWKPFLFVCIEALGYTMY